MTVRELREQLALVEDQDGMVCVPDFSMCTCEARDGMKLKHVGLAAHRLQREPNERAFAKAWSEKAPSTLGYLLEGQDKFDHCKVSQRDAEVAATIIQWLGSPVGSCFVDEVRNSK